MTDDKPEHEIPANVDADTRATLEQLNKEAADKKADEQPETAPAPEEAPAAPQEAAPKEDEDSPALPMWQLRQIEKRLGRQFSSQLSELKEAIAQAAAPATPAATADAQQVVVSGLDELAAKYKLDPQFVKDLGSTLIAAVPKAGLDEETQAQLDEAREERFWKQQDTMFSEEFAATAKEFSDLDLRSIRDRLYNLAFHDPKYAKYALSDIVRIEKDRLFPPKGRRTAEPSRGGTAGAGVDLSRELTAEQIQALSPEEFATYSDNLAKSSRSKITRRGQTL